MSQTETSSNRFVLFSLTEAAVFLPAIHFAATITYLYAYALVYGSGMINMVSFADVGSTAIRAMPNVYISALVTVFLTNVVAPKFQRKALITDQRSGVSKGILVAVGLILAIAFITPAIGMWLSYRNGGAPFQPIMLATPWITLLSAFGFGLTVHLKLARPAFVCIMFLMTVFAMSSYRGGEAAQDDKYATYGDPLYRRAKCKGNEILNSIGDGFLILKPDGYQQIVNGECAARFDMPPRKWWDAKLKRDAKLKQDARAKERKRSSVPREPTKK
jgi:hypothetical protein